MLRKIILNGIKSALLGVLGLCLLINFQVQAAQSADTQVLLNVSGSQPIDTDIILIVPADLEFSPAKNQNVTFGYQNLTIRVKDTRMTTATCHFRLKPYGSPDSDYAVYSPRLTIQTSPYTNQTCQTVFPASLQSIPRWDVEIRLTNTNTGKTYGADISYFMGYGAIGVVSLSGRPCNPNCT
jgi:hypothetical protein